MVLQLLVKTAHYGLYENHGAVHKGDSGVDIFFPEDIIVPSKQTILIDLGIKCEMREINNTFKSADQSFFINKSYYLYPRSSIYKTPLRLANSVGIIDSGYRGNIKVAVDNISDDDYCIKRGVKLFQICAPDLSMIQIVLTDTLTESVRGTGGFGSTGA